jgi:hypothetical protein
MPTAALSALPIVSNAIVAVARRILKLPFPTNLEVTTIFNVATLLSYQENAYQSPTWSPEK